MPSDEVTQLVELKVKKTKRFKLELHDPVQNLAAVGGFLCVQVIPSGEDDKYTLSVPATIIVGLDVNPRYVSNGTREYKLHPGSTLEPIVPRIRIRKCLSLPVVR